MGSDRAIHGRTMQAEPLQHRGRGTHHTAHCVQVNSGGRIGIGGHAHVLVGLLLLRSAVEVVVHGDVRAVGKGEGEGVVARLCDGNAIFETGLHSGFGSTTEY